jgi:hypothetical protein
MEYPEFSEMNEAEMSQWVNENPGKVNVVFTQYGGLLLHYAARLASPSFVAELVDKHGASTTLHCIGCGGGTALNLADSAATISVLMERGANPTAVDSLDQTPLMNYGRLRGENLAGDWCTHDDQRAR